MDNNRFTFSNNNSNTNSNINYNYNYNNNTPLENRSEDVSINDNNKNYLNIHPFDFDNVSNLPINNNNNIKNTRSSIKTEKISDYSNEENFFKISNQIKKGNIIIIKFNLI